MAHRPIARSSIGLAVSVGANEDGEGSEARVLGGPLSASRVAPMFKAWPSPCPSPRIKAFWALYADVRKNTIHAVPGEAPGERVDGLLRGSAATNQIIGGACGKILRAAYVVDTVQQARRAEGVHVGAARAQVRGSW